MGLPVLTKGKRDLRLGVSLVLYSARSLQEITPAVADVVEAYLEFIRPNLLRNCFGNDDAGDGTYRPLTKNVLQGDLKRLRALPARMEGQTLEYVQGSGSGPGTHSIFFEGSKLSGSEDQEEETNLLKMDFPPDVLLAPGLDGFLAFVVRVASAFPFQTGHCGYCLQQLVMGEADVDEPLLAFLPRYAGVDPTSSSLRYDMRGHTFGAHWIELLDRGMAKKLGGLDAIRKKLPKADVRALPDGVLIRGAKLPPVADLRKGAADVGLLPDVARLLKRTRVDLDELGLTADFDAAGWLARYDQMKSKAWDNR